MELRMNSLLQPFKKTFLYLLGNSLQQTRANKNAFILYKIVDSYDFKNNEYYSVQCINTKAILQLTINQIVFDLDILHGLHPIKGCFIDIEYAKVIKTANCENTKSHKKSQNMFREYSMNRYGSHNLLYQDRNGLLGFEYSSKGESFLMDPRDIALTRELIEEFDAAQAFCIGVLAGLKFVHPVSKHKTQPERKKLIIFD
jgi:hypothetical protein